MQQLVVYPCQTLHSNDCSGINKKEWTRERWFAEEPVDWTQERWFGEEPVDWTQERWFGEEPGTQERWFGEEPVDWTRECWRWTGRADWTVDLVFMVALADPLRNTHYHRDRIDSIVNYGPFGGNIHPSALYWRRVVRHTRLRATLLRSGCTISYFTPLTTTS